MKKKNNKNSEKSDSQEKKKESKKAPIGGKPQKVIQREKSITFKSLQSFSKVDQQKDHSLPEITFFQATQSPKINNVQDTTPQKFRFPQTFNYTSGQEKFKDSLQYRIQSDPPVPDIQNDTLQKEKKKEQRIQVAQKSEEQAQQVKDLDLKNEGQQVSEDLKEKQIPQKVVENPFSSPVSIKKQINEAFKKNQHRVDTFRQSIEEKVKKIQISVSELAQEKIQKRENPYEDSLLSSLVEQISETTLEFMNNKLQSKVDSYFKDVMQQTKQIFDKTSTYYIDRGYAKDSSFYYQLDKQEQMIQRMKVISGGMKASIHSVIIEGEDRNGMFLKQWEENFNKIHSKLDKNSELLEIYENEQPEDQKQKNFDSLSELKEQLLEPKELNKKQNSSKKKKRAAYW